MLGGGLPKELYELKGEGHSIRRLKGSRWNGQTGRRVDPAM